MSGAGDESKEAKGGRNGAVDRSKKTDRKAGLGIFSRETMREQAVISRPCEAGGRDEDRRKAWRKST